MMAATTQGRLTVTIACLWCPWTVRMTADDPLELGRFLAARVAEHVSALHPDHVDVARLLAAHRLLQEA
jgi:hypothetical protein